MKTVAITGATGQLGSSVLNHLLANPSLHVIAVARDLSKLKSLNQDKVEWRIADYADRASVEAAFQNVHTVLQISTTAVGTEGLLHESQVIEAAKRAHVRHIVYTSSLRPTIRSAFQGAHQALAAEKAIRESGMSWTFFRNGLYLEVIPQLLGEFRATGTIRYPAGAGRVAFVSREDIARALAIVLSSEAHENKTYEITGAASASLADIASMLGDCIGNTVAYEPSDEPSFRESIAPFMSTDVVEFLTSLARGIRDGEFDNPDPFLGKLLGTQLVSLKSYLETTFKSSSS